MMMINRKWAFLTVLAVGACSEAHWGNGDIADWDDQAPTVSPGDDEVDPTEPRRENAWTDTVEQDISTFSVDVDSGSYTLARRDLDAGAAPDPDKIRPEEFINYFDYDLPRPSGDLPFAVTLEAAPSVFGPDDDDGVHLLQIGIQAEEVAEADRDPVNLVFLLDVSGSMNDPSKLGLLKYAMKQLVDKLAPSDTLGIVVYAGADGVVLEPTPVFNKSAILDALDNLRAGGSTNGEAGIETAYKLAERLYKPEGVNRVVLCTDGDFNVGLTGDDLIARVSSWRDRGIFLTTLGVGQSYTQDHFMEQLADNSNGNYGFIDSRNEATRMLGDKLVSTLQVVAKDTKVQVAFDPSVVERWRLIGYENRLLDEHEFDDDGVDAGDIGAGHSAVALYEVDLVDGARVGDLAKVAIRYKEPTGTESTKHEWALAASDRRDSFDEASADLRLAAGVTEFAEILRQSQHVDTPDLDAVYRIVEQARTGDTRDASEAELMDLITASKAHY